MERYREGGPMKGSSIIMAAWDHGGRGKLKRRKNRDDNAGVLYEMEWWVMRRDEKRREKGQQHCIYSANA
jgi:hypothetical protein